MHTHLYPTIHVYVMNSTHIVLLPAVLTRWEEPGVGDNTWGVCFTHEVSCEEGEQLMMLESKRLIVQKRSMSYIALLTHWHHFMSICTLLMQSSVPCIPSLSSLPLTGWPGHECRNGSHHMVLSECRGVFEEGGGDHQTVWDLHQTGALHKIVYQSIHT